MSLSRFVLIELKRNEGGNKWFTLNPDRVISLKAETAESETVILYAGGNPLDSLVLTTPCPIGPLTKLLNEALS